MVKVALAGVFLYYPPTQKKSKTALLFYFAMNIDSEEQIGLTIKTPNLLLDLSSKR